MIHSNERSRRGQALVEVMVALTALTVGFLGVVALLAQSFSANRVVSSEYVATYLAVEGTEIVKNIIDSNYANSQPWDNGLATGRYAVNPALPAYSPGGFVNSDTGPLPYVGSNNTSVVYCPSTAHFVSYSSCPSGGGSVFTRTVAITHVPGSDEMKVVAHVTSTVGTNQYGFDVETHYYNWWPK